VTAARRTGALTAFHWVLGLFLLYASATTAWNAIRWGGGRYERHVAVLAAVEAVGAVLFLVPRTLRAGAIILLATIGVAFLVHLAFREARVDLMVYAAGVALVLAEHPRAARS
jgi:hypothetical protein